MDRLDGHPELKKWDIAATGRFSKRPKNARSGVKTAPNDPSLLTRGAI